MKKESSLFGTEVEDGLMKVEVGRFFGKSDCEKPVVMLAEETSIPAPTFGIEE